MIGAISERPRSAKEDTERLRGVTVVVISSLMLVALVLRVKGLGATNIWLDEANSWRVARLPWGAMLDNLRSSPLGPLYFIILKLWMQLFGESEVALRAPSLLASVFLIPVTYLVGVRAFSRRAAIVGAVLLTLSPLQLYFAQEARMYMLLSFFAALFFLAYLRWRDATSAPVAGGEPDPASRALLWYVVAGTVMVYTNIISGTLIVAVNLDALWLLEQRRRRGAPGSARATMSWVVANGAIAAVLLLYLLTVHLGSAGASQGWRGALGPTEAVRTFFEYPLVAMHGVYYYAHDFSAAAAQLQRYPSMPALNLFLELLLVQPLTLITIILALGAGAAGMFAGARRAARHRHAGVHLPAARPGAILPLREPVSLLADRPWADTPGAPFQLRLARDPPADGGPGAPQVRERRCARQRLPSRCQCVRARLERREHDTRAAGRSGRAALVLPPR
jgi:4-amino-4-deoxy-L-arabinose transferase-like glycosyltransferase